MVEKQTHPTCRVAVSSVICQNVIADIDFSGLKPWAVSVIVDPADNLTLNLDTSYWRGGSLLCGQPPIELRVSSFDQHAKIVR
jgi:hypothetical protein